MSGPGAELGALRAVVLLLGLAVAAGWDLEAREVTDRLWQLLGIVGVGLGAVAIAPEGGAAFVLWLVVGALVLEHLFPWDALFAESRDHLVLAIDLGAFAAVIAAVAGAAFRWGIGAVGVPVLAALATVILARLLFELNVLYGGADAKALVVVGVLVPVFAAPLVLRPPTDATALAVLPFSISVLTNAALLAIVVPVGIAVRNAGRREFSFARGFTSYTIDVDDLPERFVWVRDPTLGEDSMEADVETSAEDERLRREIASRLRARGIRRVWVTPQLPFLVLLAAGAVAAFLAGNLVLDLIAAL